MLYEVFGEFPFVEAAGWAHTLCMVLQPFVRPLIGGATPLYLIDAPSRATGKGLLAEAANLIPFGYVVPTMSQPRDGDELEKRLTSVLLEGRPLVFLDNVTRLDSTHLAAALTAEVWQGRILGKSETVIMPNRALWLASGNNVTLSDELTRRVIPIRMDAGVERPEERTGFKHVPLAEYVRAHRSELVSACLSLIQAWINAGMPKGRASLGRYEMWGGVMGGILEVAGVPGFLGGRERLHAEADSETTEWAALTERWWASYGPRAVTAKDLFEVAKEYGLLLELWTGKSQLSAMQRLGRALSQKRDRVFGGFRIRNAGKDSVTRNSAYRLEEVGKRTPETPGTPLEREEVPLETLEREAEEAGCFPDETPADSSNTRQTPGTDTKHPPNTRGSSTITDDASTISPGDTGVSGVSEGPAPKTPREVLELHHLWKAGDLKGRSLELPGRTFADLDKTLSYYFGKSKASEAEREDLREIARAVLREPVGARP